MALLSCHCCETNSDERCPHIAARDVVQGRGWVPTGGDLNKHIFWLRGQLFVHMVTKVASDPLYDNSFHSVCKSNTWPRDTIRDKRHILLSCSAGPAEEGWQLCPLQLTQWRALGTKHMECVPESPHKVVTTISQRRKRMDDVLHLTANSVNLIASNEPTVSND